MAALTQLEDVAHIPAFAGTSALLWLVAWQAHGARGRAVRIAVACIALGLLFEVAQWATGTGEAEVRDVWFDVVGIGIGLAVGAIGARHVARPLLAALVVVGSVVALLVVPGANGRPDFEYASEAIEERCRAEQTTPTVAERSGPPPAPTVSYAFDEGGGLDIHDRAGSLDATIGRADAVAWRAGGGLEIDGRPPRISTLGPADELAASVGISGEVSVEAWFVATALPQSGPVRLVTVSDGPDFGEVDVHLGIEGRSVSFRIATDCDFFNWTRSDEELVVDHLHHVVGTYRPGSVEIFVDGRQVTTARVPVGRLDRWDPTMRLHLGDEATGGRTFTGILRGVAVYDRALTAAQIASLFEAGAGGPS